MTGFEPVAFALQRRCSPAELHPRRVWQSGLSDYEVGLTGLEPVTPVLSGLCSNHLSYRPAVTRPYQLRSDRKIPATLVTATRDLGKWSTNLPLHGWIRARYSRKEVIQAHFPVRLPCYDFVPVTSPTLDSALLAVRLPASGVASSHDVTGGVYKARERIHRTMADARLLATPASRRRVPACDLN